MSFATRRLSADLNLIKAQTELTKNNAKIAGRDALIKGVQTQGLEYIIEKLFPSQNSAKSPPISIKAEPPYSATFCFFAPNAEKAPPIREEPKEAAAVHDIRSDRSGRERQRLALAERT